MTKLSNISNENEIINDYNMILTNNFMLIVLRAHEKTKSGISVNAMGFAGSFLIK